MWDPPRWSFGPSILFRELRVVEWQCLQSKYFLVQKDINHMLISEESLEKITAQNPILNADIGIQSVQTNPINQN